MKNLIAIIFIAAIFASCEEVIDIELNDQDQGLFAIEAKITTIHEPTVFVCKALPVTVDKAPEGISNVIVTISDDNIPTNEIILVENSERKGLYEVPEHEDYFGETGRTYTVTILTPEGITITATETLYEVEPIDSIQVRPSLRGEKRYLGVFTFGEEPAGIGDYYKWDIYINDTLLGDAESIFAVSDEFVDGNYVSDLEIFTDFYAPNEEEDRKIKFMDTVYVHQTSISEFAYNYYYQMIDQAFVGSMFSVSPANIQSNFSTNDGSQVVGLFTAHDVSVSNAVIIDQSIEDLLNKD
jgi:Domain of unknown function (DUF4249)